MRLAALPKAFGLTKQAKGYLPHFCWIHGMSTNDCENFLQWYHSRRDDFDFQQQMLMYCRNDVQLLREACMKFQALLLSITGESVEEMHPEILEVKRTIQNGVDPLAYLTIASVCMNVFRSQFLKEMHLARTEEGEKYRKQSCTNKTAVFQRW